MKKLLILLSTLVFATGIFAAPAGTSKISLLAGAGLGFPTGDIPKGSKAKEAFAYEVGAQYSYYVAESVSLVLGAGYTKTSLRADKAQIAGAVLLQDPMMQAFLGSMDPGDAAMLSGAIGGQSFPTNSKTSTDFFIISLGARYHVSLAFFGAGASYGLKLSDRKSTLDMDLSALAADFPGFPSSKTVETTTPSKYSKNNLSIYVEGGVSFDLNPSFVLDLGARFSWGLVNTLDTTGDPAMEQKLKSHTFIISAAVGYLF